ncbi:MAG TPA: ABC transporter permease [Candidatus Bathyarchaeia archaeon]|nr:ABC transporter permease [Candidatus Bathyarchaeia archaeon]
MKWRRLRTLLRREVRATFRDPFTMSILVSVPVGALLLFGFILATNVKHLALGVLDASQTSSSRRLVAELAADGSFDPRPYRTREAIDRALVAGEIGVAIVIPPSFERDRADDATSVGTAQVQVIYDGAEAVLAGNAEGFLQGLIAASARGIAATRSPPEPGPPGTEVRSSPGAAESAATATLVPGSVDVVSKALFNATLDGKPFMVAGTFGWVLSFLTTLITAVTIVNEKLTGTFEQLQVTPATSLEILLGKLLPMGAVFAFDVVLMVLIAGLVLHVWPVGSLVFFVVLSAFYVLISLALGLVISATSSTAAEAVQKSVLFSIPLVMLSGFAFPVRNMPTVVRWVAELFPATHYIRVSRAIYIRGEGPLALLPEIVMLVVFGGILMAYALRTIGARQ